MKDIILHTNDLILQQDIIRHMTNSLPMYVLEETDSTNQFAKTVSEDCALIVADGQNAGKGRMGRTFFSPKGAGVYLSLKAEIPHLYENIPFISTLASVAVHKAIKALYNIDCSIKWVNDIYLGTKKVAGILSEVQDDTHVIIGIGINVYPSALDENLKAIATYLTEYETSVTRNKLIAEVADNLLSLLTRLPDTSFMEYYKAHSMVIGKSILCIQPDKTFPAKAIHITDEGFLVVEASDGIHTLSTGEISIRLTN